MKNTTPPSNHHYKKSLQPNASRLRSNMTKAEACLWKYVLRAKLMKGYTFNRQRPVLHFIADFFCKELNLVVEVDGFTHRFEDTQRKDQQKDLALQDAGIRVLRFTDEEVLHEINVVQKTIENWIEEKESIVPPPTPSSGGQGRAS